MASELFTDPEVKRAPEVKANKNRNEIIIIVPIIIIYISMETLNMKIFFA